MLTRHELCVLHLHSLWPGNVGYTGRLVAEAEQHQGQLWQLLPGRVTDCMCRLPTQVKLAIDCLLKEFQQADRHAVSPAPAEYSLKVRIRGTDKL